MKYRIFMALDPIPRDLPYEEFMQKKKELVLRIAEACPKLSSQQIAAQAGMCYPGIVRKWLGRTGRK
jgi:hypothetical protein